MKVPPSKENQCLIAIRGFGVSRNLMKEKDIFFV